MLIHDGATVIDANEAAAALFGMTVGELIGCPADRLAAPEDWAGLRDALALEGPEVRYPAAGSGSCAGTAADSCARRRDAGLPGRTGPPPP